MRSLAKFIVLICLLAVVSSCSDDNRPWAKYTSAEGGFTVMMPSRVKKSEKKEIDRGAEISELNGKVKENQSEIFQLKSKIKELHGQKYQTPEPRTSEFLPTPKYITITKPHHISRKSGNEIDIWRNIEDDMSEVNNLNEIAGSRELWINNLETKLVNIPNSKKKVRLFPINSSDQGIRPPYYGDKSKARFGRNSLVKK